MIITITMNMMISMIAKLTVRLLFLEPRSGTDVSVMSIDLGLMLTGSVLTVMGNEFSHPPTDEISIEAVMEFKSLEAFPARPVTLRKFMNFKCCCSVSAPTALVIMSAGLSFPSTLLKPS